MSDAVTAALISSLIGILAAIVTAFVSSTFYFRQAKADLQKEYESRFNERKWETYTRFSGLVNSVFAAAKSGKLDKDMPKFTRELLDIAGQLWIVGSDRVINAYLEWQEHNRGVLKGELENRGLEGLLKLAKIVTEMRTDLGYQADKVSPLDLLGIYIHDIKDHLK